ncbi:DUF6167 family protein [Motilibacter aurantiacus]|uniref:DUF6167 family protein n=1 Tax=Motilibacter aurantiacus TaxID=2714955 RepID=UPI001409D1B3|nr:DUF6167 family protein [Motilibacter aurantiacus]NHC46045.1 hypothetical protein [Motilibacter aurantiacus]
MIRRLFWLGLGAALGALIVRRLTRAAQALTPQSMAQTLADAMRELGAGIRDFGQDVRAAMSDREAELRDALGIPDGEAPDNRTGDSGRTRH